MNIPTRILLTVPALLAGLATIPSAVAQGAIYRCHALSGALIFQDKPCDQVATTRESQQGSAGEVVPAAAPPSDRSGPDLTERYQRVLETQNLERQAAGPAPAASGPQVTIVPSSGIGGSRNASTSSPAVETYSGYDGYSEGVYPAAPYYPPYRYRNPPSGSGSPTAYDNGAQAQPKPLPAPGLLPPPSIQNDGLGQAPKPGTRPTGPGHVVSRDPNANTR